MPDPVTACVKCGADLPTPGRGRPRRYCGTGCRRAAEYELRRVQQALLDVEDRIRGARFGWGVHPERSLPKFEAERVRLEDRLKHLLDDGPPASQPTEGNHHHD